MSKISPGSYSSIGFALGFLLGLLFFRESGNQWWHPVLIAALLGVAAAFVGFFLSLGSPRKDR